MIFPPSLKKGDHIAIISPAGSVTAAQLEAGLEMIKSQGYQPVLSQHVFTDYSNGYSYAGTEEERMADLHWALSSPDISAIWTSRGGYGCQHLLQGLDLKEFQNNPKWFIGYSDNTVLQSYLFTKGFASIHGQSLKTASFGVSAESYALIFDILKGKKIAYHIPASPLNRRGEAEGILVGGNLALIYALLGTPYGFDFRNKILFLEDVGEKFYALDRMLMSLELAGVFKQIKGLIVGGMINMGDEKDNAAYDDSFDPFALKIVAERVAKFDFPVLYHFPNGHIFENSPLVIGARVHLKAGETCSLKFYS